MCLGTSVLMAMDNHQVLKHNIFLNANILYYCVSYILQRYFNCVSWLWLNINISFSEDDEPTELPEELLLFILRSVNDDQLIIECTSDDQLIIIK